MSVIRIIRCWQGSSVIGTKRFWRKDLKSHHTPPNIYLSPDHLQGRLQNDQKVLGEVISNFVYEFFRTTITFPQLSGLPTHVSPPQDVATDDYTLMVLDFVFLPLVNDLSYQGRSFSKLAPLKRNFEYSTMAIFFFFFS